jgi:hypothetical protein
MIDSGQHSDDSIYPSKFDEIRLIEASDGESIDSENGNWSVLIYKDSAILLLKNHKKHPDYMEFKNTREIINFLKEH